MATIHDIPLVLASSSPRRLELMRLLQRPFTVEHSRYEEPPPPDEDVDIKQLVKELALQKAAEVAERSADALVIGADTLVGPDSPAGVPFGKPRSTDEAMFMLRRLSDAWHRVSTGIAVVPAGNVRELIVPVVDVVTTRVKFRKMSDRQIEAYIATGEPFDKAGAYGAQGFAARYIECIDGDFYNVVGLPICRLSQILDNRGLTCP